MIGRQWVGSLQYCRARSVDELPARSALPGVGAPVSEDWLKLTAYFEERQRSGGRFLTDAMLDLYEQRGVATSIVLRGIGGFGSRHHLRSDQSLSLSEDPPVAVVAVDTTTTVEGLFEPLRAMHKRVLVTLERARLIDGQAVGSDRPVAPDHQAHDLPGPQGKKSRCARLCGAV